MNLYGVVQREIEIAILENNSLSLLFAGEEIAGYDIYYDGDEIDDGMIDLRACIIH